MNYNFNKFFYLFLIILQIKVILESINDRDLVIFLWWIFYDFINNLNKIQKVPIMDFVVQNKLFTYTYLTT